MSVIKRLLSFLKKPETKKPISTDSYYDEERPNRSWSKEMHFEYDLKMHKMIEPEDEYVNKNTTRYQDFVINEELNYWDLVKLCSLNGISLQIGAGWNNLLINYLIELDKIGWNRRLSCVKEKYAELMVYFSEETTFQDDSLAEQLEEKFLTASKYTCETCGGFGRTRISGALYYVACRQHYYTGRSFLDCDDEHLNVYKEKYRWSQLIKTTIEYNYYDQPRTIILTFQDTLCNIPTTQYGFGNLVSKIPEKYKTFFDEVIFSKYSRAEYCRVCGYESFFNHTCESCEYSDILLNDKSFSHLASDIKSHQLNWFKDGAELFYNGETLYGLNPNFERLFN